MRHDGRNLRVFDVHPQHVDALCVAHRASGCVQSMSALIAPQGACFAHRKWRTGLADKPCAHVGCATPTARKWPLGHKEAACRCAKGRIRHRKSARRVPAASWNAIPFCNTFLPCVLYLHAPSRRTGWVRTKCRTLINCNFWPIQAVCQIKVVNLHAFRSYINDKLKTTSKTRKIHLWTNSVTLLASA